MHTFENYRAGDSLAELGGGVFPELVDTILEQDYTGTVEQLGSLVGAIGGKPVLRDNTTFDQFMDRRMGGADAAWDQTRQWAEATGIQEQLRGRSLWLPDTVTATDATNTVVLTDGMANWTDRAVKEIGRMPDPGIGGRVVHTASTGRVMDSPTERGHPFVLALRDETDHFPTTTRYFKRVTLPQLRNNGCRVTHTEVPNVEGKVASGNQVASALFEDNPGLYAASATVVRAANAGLQAGLQLHEAGVQHAGDVAGTSYDTQERPQIAIVTDRFPLAESPDTPAVDGQQPTGALRQAAVTGRMLVKAGILVP